MFPSAFSPCVSVCSAALVVAPMSPEEVMQAAAEHVEAGDFAAARAVLDEAYAADPLPELLYSRAQVERLAGNCEEARRLYAEVAATAAPEDAEDARRLSERCTPRAVEDEPTPPPPASSAPPQERPPDAAPEPRPATRLLPPVALGIGLVAVATGAGLLGYAATHAPDPDAARDEGDYGERVERSESLRTTGIVVGAVGLGVAVTAAITWGVLARRRRARTLSVGSGGVLVRF